ncbi:MAG TPA: hypothetical protein DEQ03_11900 [Marinilabiliales bacterium]|nr:hypothetical protein [Marinilabiliales bacterium]
MMNHKTFSIFLLAFFLTTGCKVNYSFTGASIPEETETVSVYDFPNMAPLVNPALSNQLTEALKDKFMTQTSLQLVPQYGHLSFEGSIVDYRTQPMAIQANSDVAAQNRLTISVKVKFTNEKNPKANFDTSFSRYADYDSDKDLTSVEDALVEQILDELIDDIFNKAVVNW